MRPDLLTALRAVGGAKPEGRAGWLPGLVDDGEEFGVETDECGM
jgi:hypothetical protein